jgi:hypothetical protein
MTPSSVLSPRPAPKRRPDGLCAGCKRQDAHKLDPFCSSLCCKTYYGTGKDSSSTSTVRARFK